MLHSSVPAARPVQREMGGFDSNSYLAGVETTAYCTRAIYEFQNEFQICSSGIIVSELKMAVRAFL
jgi:hypothetical protein